MRLGLGPKPLPQKTWVSLCSALTWLVFEHAFETDELIAWVDRGNGLRKEEIVGLLTSEWQELADVACDGFIPIRAREHKEDREIPLGIEQLRNFRFICLGNSDHSCLLLDRFEPVFEAAFKARARELCEILADPWIQRQAVIAYKRQRRQAPRLRWNDAAYKMAAAWLRVELPKQERRTGHKPGFIADLRSRFSLPAKTAEKVWSETARELNWPVKGRRKNSEKENSRNT
jgi:hypothetical protein